MKKRESIKAMGLRERSKSPIYSITPVNIHRYLKERSPISHTSLQGFDNALKSQKSLTAFDPKNYLSYGLSERQIIIYKNIFDDFSNSSKGFLLPGEMRNIFKRLGISTDTKEIFKVLCDYDTKEHGYLDFEDFLKVITDRLKPYEQDSVRRKKEIYNQMTKKKKVLTLEDLERNFFQCGFTLSKQEIGGIYELLLEKAQQYDNVERDSLDFQTFKRLLLQVSQELHKEIENTKF